jgi:hypothetical protein
MRTRVVVRELVNGAACSLVFAAALLACAGPRPRAPKGEVVVTFEGKIEHGPFRFGKDDLPRLPRRSFKAQAPSAPAQASFDGMLVSTIISDEMEIGKGVDIAVFHGQDGYLAPVPIAALRQLRPILADKVNGAPIAEWNKAAAPLQLAWPNVDEPGIDTDPRMRWWWVGGVKKVELQSWVATYGKALRVPQGSSDDARLGAETISVSCLACHKVRGVGGTRGPELRSRAVPADAQAFADAMRAHLSKKTGLRSAPETSPVAARQIAAFLRAIELAGSRPDEEAPPEQPLPPPRRPGGGYGPGIGPGT